MSNLEHFIENIGEKNEAIRSFNLWCRRGNTYYNLATLFYQDPMCGTDWSVTPIEKAVSYGEREINEELETPLQKIRESKGEKLLAMADNSVEEVVSYLIREAEDEH